MDKKEKLLISRRLQRQKVWREASTYKDARIRELREGGMRREDAQEQAWREMAERWPPPGAPPFEEKEPAAEETVEQETVEEEVVEEPIPEPDPPPAPVEEVTEPPKSGPDLVRDTLWAYENLDNRKAEKQGAPSPGAWSLLNWAREYRNRFFEQLLPKAMAKVESAAPQEEVEEKDPGLDEVRAMLGQLK